MTQTFEDAGRYGREFLDTGLESFAAVARDAQAISDETSSYVKQVFESGAATVEKLLSAKSVEKVVEVQADFARQAYEGFVTESTRMIQLYVDMAKDASRPFATLVAKAK